MWLESQGVRYWRLLVCILSSGRWGTYHILKTCTSLIRLISTKWIICLSSYHCSAHGSCCLSSSKTSKTYFDTMRLPIILSSPKYKNTSSEVFIEFRLHQPGINIPILVTHESSYWDFKILTITNSNAMKTVLRLEQSTIGSGILGICSSKSIFQRARLTVLFLERTQGRQENGVVCINKHSEYVSWTYERWCIASSEQG